MISHSERAYLYWYAKHIFTGKGDIVDLGCWFGATTISLAMGLEKSSHTESLRKIYCYDEFVWRPYMEGCVTGTELEGKYNPGDSFLEEFNEKIRPWRDRIKVCPGDLNQVGWHGGRIEFLLIDAMKSWESANGVISRFFPALVPGLSLIMHQDFAHWFTSWIHPIQYKLQEYFEPAYDIPSSGSVVFKLIKPIPAERLRNNYSFSTFTNEEIEAAFNYSLGLVRRAKRSAVAAAKVMYFIHSKDFERAKEELSRFRSEGFDFDSDLSIVERRLLEEELVALEAKKRMIDCGQDVILPFCDKGA